MIYVSYRHDLADRWICLRPVTLKNEVLTVMPQCSHLMSNHDRQPHRRRRLRQRRAATAAPATRCSGDPYLHLFDLKAGVPSPSHATTAAGVVYKDNRQVTHLHPSFTPTSGCCSAATKSLASPRSTWLMDVGRRERKFHTTMGLLLRPAARWPRRRR